jgi:DNA invertase Pin-like site-specific DNA recombinase
MTTARPLAYSYIRFSHSKQAAGDSVRRQTELAAKYALKHGFELDRSLKMSDLGVSAFKGSHAQRGAFSRFLDAIEMGRVPLGSFLLVEQLDRLSRETPFLALTQLQSIISAGVNVVTLTDDRVYTTGSLTDLGTLMVTIAIMSTAYEESQKKSQRIGAAWQTKRNIRSPVMSSECPRWLRAREDKSGYDIIEEKAASVRRVFALTISGYGNSTIIRMANAEGWTHPGKAVTWNQSIISKLVRNPAVIGTYMPKKINHTSGKPEKTGESWDNYYPAIISSEDYILANAVKDGHAKIPRRRDSHYKNLFQGLLTCGCCGSSLVRKNKGGVTVQNGYFIYMCSQRVEFVTKCKSSPGIPLESNLLTNLYVYGYAQMRTDEEAEALAKKIVLLNSDIDKLRIEQQNYGDYLAKQGFSEMIAERLSAVEKKLDAAKLELTAAKKSTAELQLANNNISAMLSTTFDVDYARIRDDSEVTFRAEVREKILSAVRRIVVYAERGAAVLFYKHSTEPTIQVLDADLYDMDPDAENSLIEEAKKHLKETD